MSSKIKTVLKALISLGLLGYLVYLADPAKILVVLSRIWNQGGISDLIIAVGFYVFSVYMLTIRWQILVKGYGHSVSNWLLFKFYFIGMFFNNFLPTSIGGDVLRIYNLIQVTGERTHGFSSVLTERLMGVTATLIFAIVSIFALSDMFRNYMILYIAFCLLLFIILFFVLVFNDHFMNFCLRNVTKIKFFRLGERVIKFLDALRFYRESKFIYIKILLISMLAQAMIILMTFFLARSVSVDVSLGYLFFAVPIAFLLSMMPSINGIGFREGGYVVLLGNIGINKAAALSISFLSVLVPMLISIFGAVLFLMQKKAPKKEAIELVEKGL